MGFISSADSQNKLLSITGVSRFSNPGAQTIGPGACSKFSWLLCEKNHFEYCHEVTPSYQLCSNNENISIHKWSEHIFYLKMEVKLLTKLFGHASGKNSWVKQWLKGFVLLHVFEARWWDNATVGHPWIMYGILAFFNPYAAGG